MLCDVITKPKITWRYIRLLFNQTRQKLILLRFMIETNLFSLAASVMSSNLCLGSSILKNPSLNTLERERAKIPSAIYHEQLFSLPIKLFFLIRFHSRVRRVERSPLVRVEQGIVGCGWFVNRPRYLVWTVMWTSPGRFLKKREGGKSPDNKLRLYLGINEKNEM